MSFKGTEMFLEIRAIVRQKFWRFNVWNLFEKWQRKFGVRGGRIFAADADFLLPEQNCDRV